MTMYKERTYTRLYLAGLAMVLAGMLAACSSDPSPVGDTGSGLNVLSLTRSGEPMTVGDDYSPVGMFLVESGAETQSSRFTYKPNETLWRSNLEVVSGHNYTVYGYAPADAVSAAISGESAAGATMTFSNLPTVSSHDICFVVGVQQLTTIADAKAIPLGQLSFTGRPQDENFANLLMDHLYASVRFQMSINSDYAQLRGIRVKKMELKTSKSTASATVVLATNTTGASPVQSVSYSSLAGTERTATFFESTEGQQLDATVLTEAMCCFVPELSHQLTLVTTYDVYDRYDHKISERTATNKLPNLNAQRGERVTIQLNINPTYLGTLSDPDLDNPAVVVN